MTLGCSDVNGGGGFDIAEDDDGSSSDACSGNSSNSHTSCTNDCGEYTCGCSCADASKACGVGCDAAVFDVFEAVVVERGFVFDGCDATVCVGRDVAVCDVTIVAVACAVFARVALSHGVFVAWDFECVFFGGGEF